MNSKPTHFLLVEDDDAHAELTMLALSEHQSTNTIDRVSDGEQAVAYLRQQDEYVDKPRPDVIILDLKLPKIGGLEVLDIIKKNDSLKNIPTVTLTTSANEKDRAMAYERNVNSFLTKPIDFDDFQSMIRDLSFYWSVWNQPPVTAA